jgi:TPR repeat protein
MSEEVLAEMLEDQFATPAQLYRAVLLARTSAEAGFGPGQYNYGRMLKQGIGVPVDLKEAGR